MTQARKTVPQPLAFTGRGIHTNAESTLVIHPSFDGAGIQLKMTGTTWPLLPATFEFGAAAESDRRTVMRGPDGQLFQQLEHVMAALAACGVTDAVLEQSGPEPPFLGGGAKEYMDALLESGFAELDSHVEPLVVTRAFHLQDVDAHLVATPHDGFRLSCFVEFPGTVVGSRGFSIEISAESFAFNVAPARTFARQQDLEMLRQAGLAKGGTLENAVVFNETGYLNQALYFDDEVVRHKVIDLLGDLALIGRPLRGHFWAWRAGHRSHVRFAQALAKEFPE